MKFPFLNFQNIDVEIFLAKNHHMFAAIHNNQQKKLLRTARVKERQHQIIQIYCDRMVIV